MIWAVTFLEGRRKPDTYAHNSRTGTTRRIPQRHRHIIFLKPTNNLLCSFEGAYGMHIPRKHDGTNYVNLLCKCCSLCATSWGNAYMHIFSLNNFCWEPWRETRTASFVAQGPTFSTLSFKITEPLDSRTGFCLTLHRIVLLFWTKTRLQSKRLLTHKSKIFGYHFCSTCSPPMTSLLPDFYINIAQNNNCTIQKIHGVHFWCGQVKPWSFHSCRTLMSHGGEGFLAWVRFIQQAGCGNGGRWRIEHGPIRVTKRSSSKPLCFRYVFYGCKASVTSFFFGCQILNLWSAYSHSRPGLLIHSPTVPIKPYQSRVPTQLLIMENWTCWKTLLLCHLIVKPTKQPQRVSTAMNLVPKGFFYSWILFLIGSTQSLAL